MKLVAKLNVRQVAERTGVCKTIVYGWCHSRVLPFYRLGGDGKRGKILIDDGDLAEFLRSRRVEPATTAPVPAAKHEPVKLRHLRLPS
jgi:excisionase family DNA binding protein